MDKILFPSRLFRVLGAIGGSVYGYGYSYHKESSTYKRDDLPNEIHVVPSIMAGTVGSIFPIIPAIMTVGVGLTVGSIYYDSWKRTVINDHFKTK